MKNEIAEINWDLLSKSPTINPYLFTIVDKIPTMFFKAWVGFYFLIAVSEEILPEICSQHSATRSLLQGQIFRAQPCLKSLRR